MTLLMSPTHLITCLHYVSMSTAGMSAGGSSRHDMAPTIPTKVVLKVLVLFVDDKLWAYCLLSTMMKWGLNGNRIPFIQKWNHVGSTQTWYICTLHMRVFPTGVFSCNKDPKIWIFAWILIFLWIFGPYKDSWNFYLFTLGKRYF
jgi:hypothetical protein